MNLYRVIRCQSSPELEENIYLFINWFGFNLERAGFSHRFEIETHLSIVQKIKFQLETNLKNAANYIFYYLKNPLFDATNPTIFQYDLGVDFKNIILGINSGLYGKSESINGLIKTPSFKDEIDQLNQELEQFYLNDILDNLLSLLYSSDLVSSKLGDLKYHVKLLISYFLFKGYSYSDLIECFMIASNFPPRFGFENQQMELEISRIEDIINYFHYLNQKNDEEFNFFIPIKDLDYEHSETLQYKIVEFVPRTNLEIQNLLERTRNEFNNWLVNIDTITIFAKIKIMAKSISSAKQKAHNYFKSEVEFLNNALAVKGALLEEFFIGYGNGTELRNFGYRRAMQIGELDIELFKNNPFELYRNNLTPAKETIIKQEHLFVDAINMPTDEKILVNLWVYLESLFPEWKKKHKLKDLISYLLLNKEDQFDLKAQINETIFELLRNERNWELGLDYSKQLEFTELPQVDIPKFRTEIRNPFIQVLLDEYENFHIQQHLKNSKSYYLRLMDELFSVRNSFVHSGATNELSIIKLNQIIPFLVFRIRAFIHSEINRANNLDDIIAELYANSQLLI